LTEVQDSGTRIPEADQFRAIAPYYDALMAGVPYGLWVGYIQDILSKLEFKPQTVLDLACGTGTVSELLHCRGYDVIGVDLSEDMIEVAKAKSGNVEYHAVDAADMELDRTFDMVICLFDSLNYFTDLRVLRKSIANVGRHTREGGLFIFDVNTIYALSNHFFDQANMSENAHPKYIWTSKYDHSTRICTVNMIFEIKDARGRPVQFKEIHVQKGYTLEELGGMLTDAGFETLAMYNAYKFTKPTRRSDRVFFVARKVSGDA
jgi:SAM-dependent methyltransferase